MIAVVIPEAARLNSLTDSKPTKKTAIVTAYDNRRKNRITLKTLVITSVTLGCLKAHRKRKNNETLLRKVGKSVIR